MFDNESVLFHSCIFEYCGVDLEENGMVSVNFCKLEIINCSCISSYGFNGIFYAEDSIVSIVSSNFTHNIVYDDGGVIWADNSDITINKSVFYRNISPTTGGAIYCINSNFSAALMGCIHNQAGHQASACYFQGCEEKISFYMCHFINNVIADIGDFDDDEIGEEDKCGVLHFNDCSNVNIYLCRFVGNKAGKSIDHSITAMGCTIISVRVSYFDHKFNDTIFAEPDSADNMPIIKGIHCFYSTLIPRRYSRFIEQSADLFKRYVVKVDSGATISRIIVTMALFAFVILAILFALNLIGNIF